MSLGNIYYLLFDKLLHRGLPKIVVRILMVHYSNVCCKNGIMLYLPPLECKMVYSWGSIVPSSVQHFYAKLSSINVGCYINSVCYNHSYADDRVLLTSSGMALKVLIEDKAYLLL